MYNLDESTITRIDLEQTKSSVEAEMRVHVLGLVAGEGILEKVNGLLASKKFAKDPKDFPDEAPKSNSKIPPMSEKPNTP